MKGKDFKKTVTSAKKHPLNKEEDYRKGIYISMLYAIALQDEDIDGDKGSFVSRIAEVIGIENSSKYIKQAMNINEEMLSEFSRLFSGKGLANNFFLDSLMLVKHVKSDSNKGIELIAEYAEILKINKAEVENLTELAIAILEQSSEKYHSWLNKKPASIYSSSFIYHTKQFASGIIVRDDNYEYWTGKFELSENIFRIYKDIEIEDADITLPKEHNVKLNTCNTVSIVNSDFKGYRGIEIENGGILEIENSIFRDFESRALKVQNLEKFSINNSKFLNCSNYKESEDKLSSIWFFSVLNSSVLGGAIYAKNIRELQIENSEFKDCTVKSETTSNLAGAAVYIDNKISKRIQFKNNVFKSCNSYGKSLLFFDKGTVCFSNYEFSDDGSEERRLVNSELISENNRFQNCRVKTNITNF